MKLLTLPRFNDEPPRDPDDAAAWWVAAQRSTRWSRAHQRRLEAWLEADPDHGEALARTERAWDAVGMLAAHPYVLSLRERALAKPHGHRTSRALSYAACLVCAVAVASVAAESTGRLNLKALVWGPGAPKIERYETPRGNRSTVVLTDGSRVDLNGGSLLEVEFSRRSRTLRLQGGEAWFAVAEDESRPFIVQAGGRTITDIGTVFTVRVKSKAIEVAVAEGKVGVAAAEASPMGPRRWTEVDAGEKLMASADGEIQLIDVDVASLGDWRFGRVQFADTPLSVALDEMNRYAPVPMRLADPSLGDLRVSGVFFTDGANGFLTAVSTMFDLTVERADAETVLVKREGRGLVRKKPASG